MSNNINNIIRMYNKKDELSRKLHGMEYNIISERSNIETGYDGIVYNIPYSIVGSDEELNKELEDLLIEDIVLDGGETLVIHLYEMVALLKERITNNNYISLAMSNSDSLNEVKFALNLSVHKGNNAIGNYIEIDLIKVNGSEVVKLIDYSTAMTQIELTGDEKSVVYVYNNDIYIKVGK